MNKYLLLIILLDLFVLTILSLLFGYGFYLLGNPFIPSLLFSFGCLVIIGVISNFVVRTKIESKARLLEYETATMLASQTMSVNCAYCRAPNVEYLNLNRDMFFNCVSCKQPNKIIISYGATRVTTPLNTEVNVGEVLSSVDEILNNDDA